MPVSKRHFTLISKSTRDLIGEARQARNYSLWDFIHGYFYARWTYLYIGVGTGTHPLSRLVSAAGKILQRLPRRSTPNGRKLVSFADTYHGKVVPLPAARRLVEVKQDIRLENLENVVPYALARDIILKNPDHIVALECPCRAGREKPCLPLDVCLIVGEPFASLVQEHHPQRSHWVSTSEAVAILQAEDERGHVHHAFFKDAMLGRFYAICNCCACCCGAMQAHRSGTPMLASSGYTARVDDLLCAGCGACADACPFGAVTLPEGTAVISEETCMGCGVCVNRCPSEALSLQRTPWRGEPLEIQELMALAG